MKRVILLEKRKKARELNREGWSIQKISCHLGANWESVKRWLEMDLHELDHDRRGRTRGKMIKYDGEQKRRVLEIRRRLRAEGRPYGASPVSEAYTAMYGGEVSVWFVNAAVREAKLERELRADSEAEPTIEFPLRRLTSLGKIVMDLNFVGVRRARGDRDTTCFLLARYLSPARLGVLAQVSARSTDEVKKTMRYVWLKYVKPDVMRMNLHPAFGAGLPHPRVLGGWALALLNLGIVPFFTSGSGAAPLELGRLDKIFDRAFADKLLLGNERSPGISLRNFYLEYLDDLDKEKGERLKVPALPFNRWVSGADLENRHIRHLQETRIFFFTRVTQASRYDGSVRILSCDVPLPGNMAGEVVLCRLDVKKRLLSVMRDRGAGALELVWEESFIVENIRYR